MAAIEAQAAGLPCVISDAVTGEVDIGGDVVFLPTDEPGKWVTELSNKMSDMVACADHKTTTLRNGYDAKTEGKVLENYYIRLVEKLAESKKK